MAPDGQLRRKPRPNRADRREAEKICRREGHREKQLVKLVGERMETVWHCVVCGADRPLES